MNDNEFFKAVDSNSKNKTKKAKIGFFKGVFIPFVSGILGTILVVGLCINVPEVKNKLADFLQVSSVSPNSNDITPEDKTKNEKSTDEKDTTVVLNTAANAAFEAFDEVAYTLPKTGGSGVYVYTIGGILLMIAGALLLYKNKNNKNK